MAKRLKLRIARAFQSCRSKDASSLPSDPVPSFLRLPPVSRALIAVDLSSSLRKPHRSFLNRHVPHALMPYGCSCSRPRPSSHSRLSDDDRTGSQPRFHWKQEGGFHVMATAPDEHAPRRKIYTSSASASGGSEVDHDDDGADVVLALSPVVEKKKRRARSKKKITGIRFRGRLSTSSMDSGLFSSEDRGCGGGGGGGADYDDDEETETLVSSSRSFSTTDSSSDHAFNPQLETIREAPRRRRRRRRRRKKTAKARKSAEGEAEAEAARLSVFRRMMPCGVMEGKVRESFAVVKRTQDPRGDFKRSMVEMIVEKQMFAEEDLQQLLRCLLSLNSRDHHGVIVDAFSEIWEALFGRRSSVCGR